MSTYVVIGKFHFSLDKTTYGSLIHPVILVCCIDGAIIFTYIYNELRGQCRCMAMS